MTNEYSSCIHEAYAIQRGENLNIIYICSKRSVIGIFKVLQKTVGRIWRVIWECYARCHSYKKNELWNGSYNLSNSLFLCIRKNNEKLKGFLVIKTKELCYIIVF